MIPEANNTGFADSLSLLEKSATVLYGLILGLIPFLFIPVPLFDLPTISSEILLVKEVGIRLFCGGIILLGSIRIFREGFAPLRRNVLFSAALLAYSAFALLSCAFSANAAFSLRYFYSEQLLILAVLLVPYFFRKPVQVQFLALAALTSTLLCALFSVAVWFTDGEALVIIYGANVRDLFYGGNTKSVIEGGSRSVYMSTLGNPEFAGNFLAIGVLLSGMFSWNQFGNAFFSKRPYLAAGIGICLMGITGAAMLLTQTRGSLLILAFCGVVWLFFQLRFSVRLFALGLVLSALIFFLFNPIYAVCFLALFLMGLFFWRLKIQGLNPYVASFAPHQRMILLAGVLGVLLAVLAGLFVPQVRGRLIPLTERITSAGSVNDRSIRERLIFYTLASEMVSENPLLGVGPGMYPANFHDALSKLVLEDESGVMAFNQRLLKNFVAFEAHNDYFQIASEQGLIGILLFLFAVAALLQQLVHLQRFGQAEYSSLALAFLIALLGYLFMMTMSFPLQEPARAAHFFGLLAAAYALVHVARLSSEQRAEGVE